MTGDKSLTAGQEQYAGQHGLRYRHYDTDEVSTNNFWDYEPTSEELLTSYEIAPSQV